jgi:hypothetical protein
MSPETEQLLQLVLREMLDDLRDRRRRREDDAAKRSRYTVGKATTQAPSPPVLPPFDPCDGVTGDGIDDKELHRWLDGEDRP